VIQTSRKTKNSLPPHPSRWGLRVDDTRCGESTRPQLKEEPKPAEKENGNERAQCSMWQAVQMGRCEKLARRLPNDGCG
jgi:hypothetical protein